jgi:hypothetical protein
LGVEDAGQPTSQPAEQPSQGSGDGQSGGGDGGEQPQGDVDSQIRSLLAQAEEKFNQADAAQRDGDTVRWARLTEEARDLIAEAVRLSER